MLRYKTETRPGLVALYDNRPGNGARQFLQPRSPHGATDTNVRRVVREMWSTAHDMFSLPVVLFISAVFEFGFAFVICILFSILLSCVN